MEDLSLSEFSRLSTLTSHSDLLSYTEKEIDFLALTLPLFKPPESDSFTVKVESQMSHPIPLLGLLTCPIP